MGELQETERYLACYYWNFHLLRQGDHERLLEVAGVHEGDRLHGRPGWMTGRNAEAPDAWRDRAAAITGGMDSGTLGAAHRAVAVLLPGRAGGGQAQPRRGSSMRGAGTSGRTESSRRRAARLRLLTVGPPAPSASSETGLPAWKGLIRQWRGVDDAVLVGLH